MAMGTSVFRIRIELIFRRCWNLITPWRSAGAPAPMSGVCRVFLATDSLARPAGTWNRKVNPHRQPSKSPAKAFAPAFTAQSAGGNGEGAIGAGRLS